MQSHKLKELGMKFHSRHKRYVAFNGRSIAFHSHFIAFRGRFLAFNERFITFHRRSIVHDEPCLQVSGVDSINCVTAARNADQSGGLNTTVQYKGMTMEALFLKPQSEGVSSEHK